MQLSKTSKQKKKNPREYTETETHSLAHLGILFKKKKQNKTKPQYIHKGPAADPRWSCHGALVSVSLYELWSCWFREPCFLSIRGILYVIFIVAFVVRRYTFESVACFGNSDRKCNRQFSFQITNIIIVIGLWGLVTEHVPNI